MSTPNQLENQLEKSLKVQILEKMLNKLNISGHFTESVLSELMSTDLTNKDSVKGIISNCNKEQENENTKTGN